MDDEGVDIAAIDARLESATERMEAGDFATAIGLLVPVLHDIEGASLESVEAMARSLLAQALASTDQLDGARDQIGKAMKVAHASGDRDVIHRCMALAASLRILGSTRL
jgi:Flp pilus assembly protein TadD